MRHKLTHYFISLGKSEAEHLHHGIYLDLPIKDEVPRGPIYKVIADTCPAGHNNSLLELSASLSQAGLHIVKDLAVFYHSWTLPFCIPALPGAEVRPCYSRALCQPSNGHNQKDLETPAITICPLPREHGKNTTLTSVLKNFVFRTPRKRNACAYSECTASLGLSPQPARHQCHELPKKLERWRPFAVPAAIPGRGHYKGQKVSRNRLLVFDSSQNERRGMRDTGHQTHGQSPRETGSLDTEVPQVLRMRGVSNTTNAHGPLTWLINNVWTIRENQPNGSSGLPRSAHPVTLNLHRNEGSANSNRWPILKYLDTSKFVHGGLAQKRDQEANTRPDKRNARTCRKGPCPSHEPDSWCFRAPSCKPTAPTRAGETSNPGPSKDLVHLHSINVSALNPINCRRIMQETFHSPHSQDPVRPSAGGAVGLPQEPNANPKGLVQTKHVARQHNWKLVPGTQPKHGAEGLTILAPNGRRPSITIPAKDDFVNSCKTGRLARFTIALRPRHLLPIHLVYGNTGHVGCTITSESNAKRFKALMHEWTHWSSEPAIFAADFNCEPKGDPTLAHRLSHYQFADLGNMGRWGQGRRASPTRTRKATART